MHPEAPIRVYLARSESLRRVHFGLRYRIYCVENGYEPASRYRDGLERDALDQRSEHFVVRVGSFHGRGRWVGTMRLILPDGPHDPDKVPPLEISRLIACDAQHLESSRVLYHLSQAAQAYAVEHGYPHLQFLIRPALARLLCRFGLPLEQCGEARDHRGLRIPYRVDAAAAADRLRNWRQRYGLPAVTTGSHYIPMYWPLETHPPDVQDVQGASGMDCPQLQDS